MRDVWLLLLELKQTVCGSQMCCDVVTATRAVFTCPQFYFLLLESYIYILVCKKKNIMEVDSACVM
jgi:hypothetical protein